MSLLVYIMCFFSNLLSPFSSSSSSSPTSLLPSSTSLSSFSSSLSFFLSSFQQHISDMEGAQKRGDFGVVEKIYDDVMEKEMGKGLEVMVEKREKEGKEEMEKKKKFEEEKSSSSSSSSTIIFTPTFFHSLYLRAASSCFHSLIEMRKFERAYEIGVGIMKIFEFLYPPPFTLSPIIGLHSFAVGKLADFLDHPEVAVVCFRESLIHLTITHGSSSRLVFELQQRMSDVVSRLKSMKEVIHGRK